MDKIGSITASAQSIAMDVSDIGTVALMCSGTFAGVNCTFEASLDSTDGTTGTWFGIQALRSNANTIELVTGVLGAAPAYCWDIPVAGYKYIRVRSTAWTSGTQVWMMRGHAAAVESIPYIPTTITSSGTSTTTPAAPTTHTLASAATTNATSVKASAGTVYSLFVSNTSAAVKSLKMYNKASAPTVGTDQPIMTITVPATSQVSVDCGPLGVRFATGIALAMTGLATLADTTAVAVNDLESCVTYI